MAYKYTTIDGCRVEVNVAARFMEMRAAFAATFGLVLFVSDGTRTRAEQQKLWDDYRAGRGNLAAEPGKSNHEENGPTGPRALDLRDSGKDAGVTVIGSARSNWLAANAHRWGFKPAGHSFKPAEGWHYEYTGVLSNVDDAASPVVRSQQEFLNSTGAKLVVDGIRGPKTITATAVFQKAQGLVADGIWGPKTEAAKNAVLASRQAPKPAPVKRKTTVDFGRVDVVQRKLRDFYHYGRHLKVDNVDGPQTIAVVKEFQRRAGLVVDGVAGPATRKKLGV